MCLIMDDPKTQTGCWADGTPEKFDVEADNRYPA